MDPSDETCGVWGPTFFGNLQGGATVYRVGEVGKHSNNCWVYGRYFELVIGGYKPTNIYELVI